MDASLMVVRGKLGEMLFTRLKAALLLCNLLCVYYSLGFQYQTNAQNQINGLLNIYKPAGVRCTHVTNTIKRLITATMPQQMLRAAKVKVGHGGTLDVGAEGVLAIGIGTGTRVLSKYLKGDKQYLCTGEFGYETDTNCIPGNIVEKAPYDHITDDDLNNAIKEMHGQQDQFPPIFSAKKLKGKSLYRYANKNIAVEIKPSSVTLYSIIRVPGLELPKFQIRVKCSHGCYMRSLVRDIGILLNSRATLIALVRETKLDLKMEDSIPFECLTYDTILNKLIPV